MLSRWTTCVRSSVNISEGKSAQHRNGRCVSVTATPQTAADANLDVWQLSVAAASEEFCVFKLDSHDGVDAVSVGNCQEDFHYEPTSFLLPPSNQLPSLLTKCRQLPLWQSSKLFHTGVDNRLMRKAKASKKVADDQNVFIEPNSKALLMECLITEKDITDSLEKLKIPHDSQGFTQVRLPCHHCGSNDGGYSLHLNNATGFYWCVDCHSHGTWEEFKDEIVQKKSHRKPDQNHAHHNCTAEVVADRIDSDKEIKALWSSAKHVFEDSNVKTDGLTSFGISPKISVSTLVSYGVKAASDGSGLLLPRYSKYDQSGQDKPSGLRVSAKTAGKGAVAVVDQTYPKKNFGGIFGYRLVKPEVREVVLCVSELDAMAVYQETKVVALALPNSGVDLPQEVLPYLEQFDKITLWFPPDSVMWAKTKKFAAKLGEERCYKLSPPANPGSPAECLASGQANLSMTLRRAKPFQHQSIELFSDLRDLVLDEILHKEKAAGIPFKRFPKLNEVLKGFRPGELTVLSGPTGAGKTTFLSEYSLDMCEQGVNTLWGSFEIKNESLAITMLRQFARTNLEYLVKKGLREIERIADRFERLPMYFMKFRGASKMDQVMEHVVIDNLQYMIGCSDFTGVDKFSHQDKVVEQFRRLANNSNVHVTLVIHPRKELPMTELSAVSLYGGVKASQEANNILIIQQQFNKKYLQVVKNRYGGDLWLGNQGSMQFDKNTSCFSIGLVGVGSGAEEKPFTQPFNKGNGTPGANNNCSPTRKGSSYADWI